MRYITSVIKRLKNILWYKNVKNYKGTIECAMNNNFSEKINDVPNQLAVFLSRKHYLHATELLVQAVSLGKNTLEGVESLKELSLELEQKKEVLLYSIYI